MKKNEKQYKKQYYKNNKEKRSIKYDCECGSIIQKYDKSRHEKSIKHQDYLKSIQ